MSGPWVEPPRPARISTSLPELIVVVAILTIVITAWIRMSGPIEAMSQTPLSNEEVVQAAQRCTRLGLNVRFEDNGEGRPVSSRCGSR